MGILGKVISSVVVPIFMSFCGIDGAVTIAESAVTDNNRNDRVYRQNRH